MSPLEGDEEVKLEAEETCWKSEIKSSKKKKKKKKKTWLKILTPNKLLTRLQ